MCSKEARLENIRTKSIHSTISIFSSDLQRENSTKSQFNTSFIPPLANVLDVPLKSNKDKEVFTNVHAFSINVYSWCYYDTKWVPSPFHTPKERNK